MNDFYTYVLFDWLATPRYVGKGKGSRDSDHEKKPDAINWIKNEFIEQTWIMLGEIPKVRVLENVSEHEALNAEIALICAIGRFPTGPLTNMSDGGDGWGKLTAEEYSKRSYKSNASQTPEKRSERLKRANANRDMKKIGRKISLKKTRWWSTLTPEERLNVLKAAHSISPEKRQKNARAGGLATAELHKPGGAWAMAHAEAMRQLIWINNGQSHRRIDKSVVIPEGWQRGRINLNSTLMWITDGQKNRKINKSNLIPGGWKRGVTFNNNNFMWITNGKINKKINKSSEMPLGWQKGRTSYWLSDEYTQSS